MQKPEHTASYEWQKNLPKLKQKFDAIKVKKSSVTNKDIIVQLNNQLVKADHVIVRQFLDKYSKTDQLSKVSTFEEAKSFFNLLKQNYSKVQVEYLKGKSQEKGDKPSEAIQSHKSNVFEHNKTNFSKFIKDEADLYKTIIKGYAQAVKDTQSQERIMGKNMIKFMKKLLNENNHMKVFKSGKLYFSESELQGQIQSVKNQFLKETRSIEEQKVPDDEDFIMVDQILEFLTFWLKFQHNEEKIYIVYARTQQMRDRLEKQYLDTVKEEEEQVKDVKDNEGVEKAHKQETPNVNIKTQQIKKSQFQNPTETQPQQKHPSQSIIDRYNQKPQIPLPSNIITRSLTKQEQLKKSLPQIFKLGCKKKTHKGTTFGQMLDEAKMMDLEKWVGFCNCFGISDLIGRDVLIEEFKVNAINRLVMDFQRFETMVDRLVQKDQRVRDKLLKVPKGGVTRKAHLSKIIENDLRQLSKYNYQIRPVNGRDIESIQTQLRQKRQLKQQLRKQKQHILLKKKQSPNLSVLSHMSTQSRLTTQPQKLLYHPKPHPQMTYSHRNQTQIKSSLRQRNNSERIKFNPESLISNMGEQDRLWEQYQAKIWKRDSLGGRNDSGNDSILEEALEKRIQKGNNVIKKIRSSNLKYYL